MKSVNNKDTRVTSMTLMIDFEQANSRWVNIYDTVFALVSLLSLLDKLALIYLINQLLPMLT